MSDSRPKKITGKFDSPYQRVAVLFGGMIAAIVLIFAINMVVQGFGGNEKKIAEALANTLKQDRINGDFTLAQQAQTNTFDAKGTFSVDKLKKAQLEAQINGEFQGETLKIPMKLATDLDKSESYVQVSNAKKTAETISASAPTIQKDLLAIAQKVDENWVKIDQSDDTNNSCAIKLFEKISKDKDGSKKLAGIYARNRFVKVTDVEIKDSGREEYTIQYDGKAMAGFVQGLKQTDIFKSVKSCDDTFDLFGSATAATAQTQPQQDNNNDTKVIVENGKIVEFVNVSSVENQVNTVRLSLNFKQGKSILMPTDKIVEYSSLKNEFASLGEIFQQQQQQQQSAALNQQAFPQQ